MAESILNSTKKYIGFEEDYHDFDMDIVMNINSVFNILKQMGVGPSDGYYIEGPNETWDDYDEDDMTKNMVKSYVYMKSKIVFDPSPSSSLNEAMKERIEELEWRMLVDVETFNV